MRVFAIAEITGALTPEERDAVMKEEVPHTLQLYLDGKIDQFWFRHDKVGVVFLVNVKTIEAAKAITDHMPLVTGGLAT